MFRSNLSENVWRIVLDSASVMKLQVIIKPCPGREDVYQQAMNEGHSAAWDQDWKKAAAAYRQALQEFPDQPRALNSLGLALFQLGEFDEALRIYQQVAQLSPDDPVALEKVAQISERVGQSEHRGRSRHEGCRDLPCAARYR